MKRMIAAVVSVAGLLGGTTGCDVERRSVSIHEPSYLDANDEEIVFGDGPIKRGKANGVLYIESIEQGGAYAWWKRPISDSVLEVTGRVTEGSGAEFGWIVIFAQQGAHTHGVQVVVFGDGRVWIRPSMFDADKSAGPEFKEIIHPAIKPAGEWNTLRIAVRKNALGVHMNGQEILEPVKLSFPLASGRVALGINAAGQTSRGRAEITSFATWPTTDLWAIPAEPATAPELGQTPPNEVGQNTTGSQP